MKRLFILFGILIILASCNQKNNKNFKSLNYTKLKQPMCYFAKTDSGFVLKAESNKDYKYKYIEYVINKNEIKMYSDSLYIAGFQLHTLLSLVEALLWVIGSLVIDRFANLNQPEK